MAEPQSVHGLFEDFAAGDTIDLLKVSVTGSSYSPGSGDGTLVLMLSDGAHANLVFEGSYGLGSFALQSDGHGGTDIVHS